MKKTEEMNVVSSEKKSDSIIASRTHVQSTEKLIYSTYVSNVKHTENNLQKKDDRIENLGLGSIEDINYNSEYVDDDDSSQSTFCNFSE